MGQSCRRALWEHLHLVMIPPITGMLGIRCSLPGCPLKPSFKWTSSTCQSSEGMAEIGMEKKVWEAGSSKAKDQGGQDDLFFPLPFQGCLDLSLFFLLQGCNKMKLQLSFSNCDSLSRVPLLLDSEINRGKDILHIGNNMCKVPEAQESYWGAVSSQVWL